MIRRVQNLKRGGAFDLITYEFTVGVWRPLLQIVTHFEAPSRPKYFLIQSALQFAVKQTTRNKTI
jgi:hypothetical protein